MKLADIAASVHLREHEDMRADIGDIVEIVRDIPEKRLRAGMRGAVVHCHSNEVCEVEFTNEHGETLDFCALDADLFIIVWRAATRQWIPLAEQASALVACLPDEAAKQVLDFARFLSVRSSHPSAVKAAQAGH